MIIKLTVDRFEADLAVLVGDNGLNVVWPKNKLPENTHEGSILNFDILADTDREAKNRQTAKDLINEIINNA